MLKLKNLTLGMAIALAMIIGGSGGFASVSAVSADGSTVQRCESFAETLPDDRFDSTYELSGDGEEPPQEEFDQRGAPFIQIVTDSKHPDGHRLIAVSEIDYLVGQQIETKPSSLSLSSGIIVNSIFSCIPDSSKFEPVDAGAPANP